jgi:hypothetical protein
MLNRIIEGDGKAEKFHQHSLKGHWMAATFDCMLEFLDAS